MSKSKLFARLTFDHDRMASLAEEAGDLETAAKHRAKGGAFRDAARLFAVAGKPKEATVNAFRAALGKNAEIEADAGPRQAGELLVSSGYVREASYLLELGGDFHQAAKCAMRCGEVARAGFLYDRAKLWTKAATAYEKADRLKDAVRVLDLELRRLAGEPSASNGRRRHQIERKRAEMLARVGKSAEAAQALRAADARGPSGEALERMGRFAEAIDAYLGARRFDQAIRLAESSPGIDPRRVPEIMVAAGRGEEAARMFAARGFAEDAADTFESVGEWGQAAKQWQAAKQSLRAAQALEKAGDPAAAAEQYELAGEHVRAAEIHQQSGADELAARAWTEAGRHAEAASAFLRSGRFFEAAERFLAAGDRESAAQSWQRVDASDPGFEAATLHLAPMLFADGKIEDALHRLRLLPADFDATTEVGKDRLYWEGRCLEALHRPAEARLRYEQLLKTAGEHRDVAARHRDVEMMIGAAQTAGAPTVDMSRLSSPTVAPEAAPNSGPDGGGSLAGPTAPMVNRREDSPAFVEPGGPPELAVGGVLADRYEVVREVGHGGMGRVYEARDRMLGDAVALKTLLAPRAGSPEEARLLREVQLCRRLTHPNIVRMHDVGRFGGGLFVTMELLVGKSLHQVLVKRRRLDLKPATTVLAQIAKGLQEAHDLGIVHRDLKPANVFVTDRHVKILDFGIARAAVHETRLTKTGAAVGSPHYMSPEQLRAEDVDARADIYSLGILAFTALAGREPYQGDSIATVAVGHLQKPVPDLRDLRSEIPAAWADFVARAMAKDKADRFQSAAELIQALAGLPRTFSGPETEVG